MKTFNIIVIALFMASCNDRLFVVTENGNHVPEIYCLNKLGRPEIPKPFNFPIVGAFPYYYSEQYQPDPPTENILAISPQSLIGEEEFDNLKIYPINYNPIPQTTYAFILTFSELVKKYPKRGFQKWGYEIEKDNGEHEILILAINRSSEFNVQDHGLGGGFDFFDNGNKIVYSTDRVLRWTFTNESLYSTPGGQFGQGWGDNQKGSYPVFSHDETLLAHRLDTYEGQNVIESSIIIYNTTNGQIIKQIVFDGEIRLSDEKVFDFSCDDKKLYFSGFDSRGSYSRNSIEIYCLDVESEKIKKITNNKVPDYHPNTKCSSRALFYPGSSK